MNFNGLPENIIISSYKVRPLNSYNKYNIENKIEDSNMKFSEKENKINMKLINKIDLKTLLDKNNNIFFQKIVDNLLSSKYYKSDYDEEYKYKLFISFQNALDYLVTKKNRLIKINTDLNSFFNRIKTNCNDLEKKLEKNKLIIEEKSKVKKENKLIYEELKKKYEEMKKKQEVNEKINNKICLKTNIISNSLKKENSFFKDENKNQELTKKYYCKICSDKFFLSKNNLEDHLIKRHPFIIIKNSPKKIENSIENKYSNKFKSLKEYYQNTYDYYRKKEKVGESLENVIKKREENHIYFQNYLNNQENNIEEIKNTIKILSENHKKFINEFVIVSGLKKNKKEIKEEKKRKEEYLKKLEKTIKESLASDKISQNLKLKIKELEIELENYFSSKNYLKDEEKENKKKNLSLIEEFPISFIKEEQKEKVEYGDKTEKIIEAIKDSSQKSSLKEENKFSKKEENKDIEKEENNIKIINGEKQNSKDNNVTGKKTEHEKKINKEEEEEQEEEEEEIKKEEKEKKEEKKEEKENKEEEEKEEEEDEEKQYSILSRNKKENPIEINRMRAPKSSLIEKNKSNELLHFLDEIFEENKINKHINHDINFSNINKKSSCENYNNFKNNQKEIKSKSEILSYEIPINSTKKDKIFQIEIEEIYKDK